MTSPPAPPLTGERTVPGVPVENYWFRRHEAAYRWVAAAHSVRGAVVIEAGCGEGYGAALLVAAGARTVAVLDLDHPTLRHVATRYPAVGAVRANLVSLPVAACVADVVVCSQVVEHLWDQDAFVAGCARVLRPGGRLVVTTPNRLTFPPGNVFHSRELDATELTDLLAAHLGVTAVLGVRPGPRLAADEEAHGDLMAAQVAAAGNPDGALLARVAAVTAADFLVDDTDLAGCLDLVATAVRR
ncbi:MAG: methyltransferase domain-containing protein [Sporichthyaceae bacterium]